MSYIDVIKEKGETGQKDHRSAGDDRQKDTYRSLQYCCGRNCGYYHDRQ